MEAATSSDTPQWLDQSTAFANHKGVSKRGVERFQRSLLANLPQLEHFLESDEQVKKLTAAVSPTSLLEQLTAGWIVFFVNRAILVFTDRRILHVPTTPALGYRDSIAEIRYSDCKDIRVRGRTLIVDYRGGKRERFLSLTGSQRRWVKEFCKGLRFDEAPAAEGPGATPRRRHLCPRCTTPLEPEVYECRSCRLAFKDLGTAIRRSVALPGGGYFYTGHPFIGIADFIAEAFLLLLFALSLWNALQGASGAWAGVVIFGVALVIEKLVTIYHAKRYVNEYIPTERPVTPQTASP